MKVIGIDPGVSGGLALYDSEHHVLLDVEEMPSFWQPLKTKGKGGKVKKRRKIDYFRLCDVLEDWREQGAIKVICEKVTAMPGNGAVSMFSFGEAYGAVLATCVTVGLNVHLVRPYEWKKLYHLSDDKNASVILAAAMFGSQFFNKAADHNKAEAALIAACGANLQDAVLGK